MKVATELAAGRRAVPAATDPERWSAVVARDAAADGSFVFAVKTTGVYCRPSCPARRAKVANVELYASTTEASEAGYRSCKRCRPDAAHPNIAEQRVRRAIAYLEDNADRSVPLEELASHLSVSPFHAQRAFKAATGLSPKQFQGVRRLATLKSRLGSGDSVSRAGYESGFGSSRSLYESAPGPLGMSPAKYRAGAKGVQITFATADTSFGWLLVAATPTGVCAVSIGDTLLAVESELKREFPQSDISRDAEGSATKWLDLVRAQLEMGKELDAIPLDLVGTAFQVKVWSALRTIPPGETRSYAQIAELLGSPRAARAVGAACGRNRLAVLVPCHRVIGGRGTLTGYRWGIERKQRLIESERRKTPPRQQ